jgi:pimeloyl-ACP methyl ester carboxylesterase
MQYDIIVLNGANGAAIEVKPLADLLLPYGRVYQPELIGHGGRPIPEKLTTQIVAADLIAFLDSHHIARAVVVGYSLGGLLGLYLARHYPDRIIGVCGVATKFIFDEETVSRWEYLGSPERIDRPGNPRKGELEKIHSPQSWAQVSIANQGWYRDLGNNPPLSAEDFAAINIPTWFFSGTEDPIVSVDEQMQLASMLRTHLGLFPGPAHPLLSAPLVDLAKAIGEWIGTLSSSKSEGLKPDAAAPAAI